MRLFRARASLLARLPDAFPCRASVPLLGFGNILWKGMKESIDKNGLIGLFMGGFTACAVGVSAALIFSYLASLIFKPKMKG